MSTLSAGRPSNLMARMRPPMILSPIWALFSACHAPIGLTIMAALRWWTDFSREQDGGVGSWATVALGSDARMIVSPEIRILVGVSCG